MVLNHHLPENDFLRLITHVNFINSHIVALIILSPFGIKGFSNYISFVSDFYLDESNKFYILKNSQYLPLNCLQNLQKQKNFENK